MLFSLRYRAATLLLAAGAFALHTACLPAPAAASSLSPTYLRCEYLVDPLGIDSDHPRLSWLLDAADPDARGQRQSAYQIQVAASRADLLSGRAGMWDTGRVASDRMAHVAYGGRTLKSRDVCWWRVRVWDEKGAVSAWSHPAFWTMGLLKDSDWKAKWVGYDGPPPGASLKGDAAKHLTTDALKWVWASRGDSPRGRIYLRKGVQIPAGESVAAAVFMGTADDAFTLFVNGSRIGGTSADGQHNWSSLSHIDVAEALKPGANVLAVEAYNAANGAAGVMGRLVVLCSSGAVIDVPIDASWKLSSRRASGWETAAFEDSGWAAAIEIASVGDSPWGVPSRAAGVSPAPRYLRKEFSISKPVRRATAYATALGLYELRINGQRVGDALFTPGWTDYHTRVCYNTYDVTDLVRSGANAAGAVLAPGWYGLRNRYGQDFRLRAQIAIEYADGSHQIIATDSAWRASFGPLTMSDIYDGESYDARREMPGWDSPRFDQSAWRPVVAEDRKLKVGAYPGVPVRRTGWLPAISVTEPTPGAFVFDLGQNFTGWARLKASGPAGTRIVMRFAEVLNPDGTIYTANLRSAKCTDTFILRGDGSEETWEPSFTFHGFRYVEVTGYPGRPALDALVGIAVNSDTPVAGTFACSNPLINKFWLNSTWTQRGNFLDIPTDCPQRDERLGWTGDAQVFIGTAAYNMDIAAFFTKWLADLRDMQAEDGGVADTAPNPGVTGGGSAAWGDAITICPWVLYQRYGDLRLLAENYGAMKRWVEYLRNHSTDYIRPATGYGDWLSINADTPRDVIATAYFAYSALLTSRAADALGKPDEGIQYQKLYADVRQAFISRYVKEDGSVAGDTQTSYLLALAFDLLPAHLREAVTARLVSDIAQRGGLSTGFVGVGHLLRVLTETGNQGVAYMLMENTTFPSWLYPVVHGATSIWERWDGWTEEKGFQNPGMNSFAHYAYGCAAEWLFDSVAGIRAEGPGFSRISIRPLIGGKLTYARASHSSIRGEIWSGWRIAGSILQMDAVIPPNAVATIHVPCTDASELSESGRPAVGSRGLKLLGYSDGAAVFEAAPGRYRFRGPAPALAM